MGSFIKYINMYRKGDSCQNMQVCTRGRRGKLGEYVHGFNLHFYFRRFS